MNISIAHFGNEECEIYGHFKLYGKTHDLNVQNENCDICKNYEIHRIRYREAREEYKNDVILSKMSRQQIRSTTP